MGRLVDAQQALQKGAEERGRLHLGFEHVRRVVGEGLAQVLAEALGDGVEDAEDDWRRRLQRERRDEADHFLVHEPVTFADPGRDAARGKELLDRYGQGAAEGREETEELLFFAKANAVD